MFRDSTLGSALTGLVVFFLISLAPSRLSGIEPSRSEVLLAVLAEDQASWSAPPKRHGPYPLAGPYGVAAHDLLFAELGESEAGRR